MSDNDILSAESAADNSDGGFDAPHIVQIDKFEGPLDLLWELIRKSRIDITEISISEITDQYIAYLKLMEKLNIRIASEFIWLASELLFYKSRAVLPSPDVSEDDFTKPKTPELIQKLLEYKKFQQASLDFGSTYEIQSDVYTRSNILQSMDGDEDSDYIDVSLFDLLKAFAGVMETTPVVERKEIMFDEVLVSDCIERIVSILNEKEYCMFTDMFDGTPAKAGVVASFLAVLEMTKAEMIRLMQHKIFGDIRLVRMFPPNEIHLSQPVF